MLENLLTIGLPSVSGTVAAARLEWAWPEAGGELLIFGLGTLVIYTAGTDHARVTLAGLEHGRALRLREHLLPSGAGDAV